MSLATGKDQSIQTTVGDNGIPERLDLQRPATHPDEAEEDVRGGGEPGVDVEQSKQGKSIDFDTVIGHIEDMLVDEEFHELQLRYLEKYWEEFVDSEENKHEYMNIFMEYTYEVEEFITNYIKNLIPHFEMEMLITELEKRRDNLNGEVFEVLFTLTDFNVFKEMFLDYRMMKEGTIIDVSQSLCVSPIK